MMDMRFEAEIIHWRGPSPYFFAPLPVALAEQIRTMSKRLSYGWGVIPVSASVNGVDFTTSLFPKEDTYLLPIKDIVRRKASVTAGDTISVGMKLKPAASAE